MKAQYQYVEFGSDNQIHIWPPSGRKRPPKMAAGGPSKNLKIFEFNFLTQNDQKLAETYSPERIFAKNAFLKIFPLVRLFRDLEKFRKI